jgi:hypothetical protein
MDACDDHLPLETGVLAQRRRHQHASLAVDGAGLSPRHQEALIGLNLRPDLRQARHALLDFEPLIVRV